MNRLNKPTAHQIDEFVNLLKAHDWFYDYSDSHNVWVAGRESANKLSAKALSHDSYNQIYRMWQDTIIDRTKFTDVVAHRIAFVEDIKAAVCSTVH